MVHVKVKNRWTALRAAFQRERYIKELGRARIIVVAHCQGITREEQGHQRIRMQKLGFECLGVTSPNDARVVFRQIKLPGLANCATRDDTVLCFSYGNEMSPMGNPETLPFVKKMIGEFVDNKKRPNDYILGASMDGKEYSAKTFQKILDIKKPPEQWATFTGYTTSFATLPSRLTQNQQYLCSILDSRKTQLES